ncbi:hypothetical protein [Pseudophaeobacter sp.]|uniref:hypothetical protein n=1 Tax=Pseudophaeobacter sp. TaxID=1971739 RepID=UPI00329A71AE
MMTTTAVGYSANSINLSLKAGVPAADASLNEGKTQGRDRALQRELYLKGAQTIAGQSQHVGPAQQTLRQTAMGTGVYSSQALQSHFLDLNSGHAPGPKPASTLIAERSYLEMRGL